MQSHERSSEPGPRVAIIGGGLSGLSTAVHLRLQSSSIELSVYESSDRFGGVIDTSSVEHPGDPSAPPFLIDHGADMFATTPPGALSLCQKLGVEHELILPNTEHAGASIVSRGKLVGIPEGFVLMRATRLLPMLTTSLLSPAGKWRLMMERWAEKQTLESDQSVADFVRHRMGEEVLQRIVGPLVAGIYTADIEKLSMHATMKPIVEMVRKHGSLSQATFARRKDAADSVERASAGARYENFRAFRGGMIELIQHLTNALPADCLRSSTPVGAIDFDSQSQRWVVTSAGAKESYDSVVLCAPAFQNARLLQSIAQPALRPAASRAAEQLSAIEYASTAIVVLVVKKTDLPKPVTQFGFVVPMAESRQILAGSFSSVKFDGRADSEHLIIRVFIGGAMQSELLEHEDSQLVKIARDELGQLIGLSGEPVVSRVIRWENAMPQYHVGHLDRVAAIDQAVEELPGLSIVSNALRGVGIAPLIGEAERVAGRVAVSG